MFSAEDSQGTYEYLIWSLRGLHALSQRVTPHGSNATGVARNPVANQGKTDAATDRILHIGKAGHVSSYFFINSFSCCQAIILHN